MSIEDFKQSVLENFNEKIDDEYLNPYGELNLWFHLDKETNQAVTRKLFSAADCLCGLHPWPRCPVLECVNPGNSPVIPQTLLASPPRTGSTLVLQIISQLKGPIRRSHEMFNDSCPILYDYKHLIYCIRHPYDIVHSFSRCFGEEKMTIEKIDELFIDLKKLCIMMAILDTPILRDRLMQFRSDIKITFVRYEDFWGDNLKLTTYLANALGVQSGHDVYKDIASSFDIQKNLEISNGLSGHDKYTQLHPNHIGPHLGKPGAGAEISEEFKQHIIENYSEFFEIFHYEKM